MDSRLTAIENFLTENGAAIFAKMLYSVPTLYRAMLNPSLSFVAGPTDAALKLLEDESDKSLKEIIKTGAGIDILANHLSIKQRRATFPMLTSINNIQYGSNAADFATFNPSGWRVIQNVAVGVIHQVILYEGQLEKLKTRELGPLTNLTYDNFLNLINLGKLEGKDLISFCLSNAGINDYCDRVDAQGLTIFDKLLLARYGMRPRGYETARERYVKIVSSYRPYVSNYKQRKDRSWDPNFEILKTARGEPLMDIVMHLTDGKSIYLLLDTEGTVWISRLRQRRDRIAYLSAAEDLSGDDYKITKMTICSYSENDNSQSAVILLDENGDAVLFDYFGLSGTEIEIRTLKTDIADIASFRDKLYLLDQQGQLTVVKFGRSDKKSQHLQVQKIDSDVRFIKLGGRGTAIDENQELHVDANHASKLSRMVSIDIIENVVEADLVDRDVMARPGIDVGAITADGKLHMLNSDVLTVVEPPAGKKFSKLWVNVVYTDDLTPYNIQGKRVVPFKESVGEQASAFPDKFLHYQTINTQMVFLAM